MLKLNTLYNGDCRELLKQLDDESIDNVITSPPYYQLRNYGTDPLKWEEGDYQLGLEPTVKMFVTHLAEIFDEVKRVLKPYGSVWVNLGDTYAGGRPGSGSNTRKHKVTEGSEWASGTRFKSKKSNWFLPDKCLCGIPWRFAIEMCDRGWVLRGDIIWYKPNVMPASVKDRMTCDHEYLFFFTKKSRDYFFEQQFVPHKVIDRRSKDSRGKRIVGRKTYFKGDYQRGSYLGQGLYGRNLRTVWKIHTRPSGVKHYASFPEKLVEIPLKATCPRYICKKCGKPMKKVYEKQEGQDIKIAKKDGSALPETEWNNNPKGHMGTPKKKFLGYTDCGCKAGFKAGVTLDPFSGIATTLITAWKLQRDYIGFELSKEFYQIALKRIREKAGNIRITDFVDDSDKMVDIFIRSD